MNDPKAHKPQMAEDELALVAGDDATHVESARSIGGWLAVIIGGGIAVFPLVFHLLALAWIALVGGADDTVTIAGYHGDTLGKVHGFFAFQAAFLFTAAVAVLRHRLGLWYLGIPVLAAAGLICAALALGVFAADFIIIAQLGAMGVLTIAAAAGAVVGLCFALMMRTSGGK